MGIINSILGIANLRLIRSTNSDHQTKDLGYISASETIKKANESGLSVCDYVEKEWDQVGETEKVIDNMEKLGVFETDNPSICEIGPGTGRYMEKVIEKCNPTRYESYETAADWAAWLEKEYQIITQNADGNSLKGTIDNSIDILHSHGVFVYLPFFDALRYFQEIDRVTHNNSMIIFDCMTNDCLEGDVLDKWLKSEYNYPQILPENYIFKFFPASKYSLAGNFISRYGQGRSKYFVFRKN